jgi:hypothetical protein
MASSAVLPWTGPIQRTKTSATVCLFHVGRNAVPVPKDCLENIAKKEIYASIPNGSVSTPQRVCFSGTQLTCDFVVPGMDAKISVFLNGQSKLEKI